MREKITRAAFGVAWIVLSFGAAQVWVTGHPVVAGLSAAASVLACHRAFFSRQVR